MTDRQAMIENPAKLFLKRYRGLVKRQESLIRSIDAAYDRATSCTTRIKHVYTQGGFAGDRMAEDIIRITDEKAQLEAQKKEVDAALAEILAAVNSVPDEMQKAVLTMRYIEGLGWLAIGENVGYELTAVYEMHGKALLAVNHWLDNLSGEVRRKAE